MEDVKRKLILEPVLECKKTARLSETQNTRTVDLTLAGSPGNAPGRIFNQLLQKTFICGFVANFLVKINSLPRRPKVNLYKLILRQIVSIFSGNCVTQIFV